MAWQPLVSGLQTLPTPVVVVLRVKSTTSRLPAALRGASLSSKSVLFSTHSKISRIKTLLSAKKYGCWCYSLRIQKHYHNRQPYTCSIRTIAGCCPLASLLRLAAHSNHRCIPITMSCTHQLHTCAAYISCTHELRMSPE